MIYVTIHAYLNGNVAKIYRGVANSVPCGSPGGVAELYPYLYFSNPIFGTGNRFCVKTCPTFTENTLSTLDCYGGSCAYTVTFDSSGSTSATIATMNSSSVVLGYETTLALDRVCLPTATVLSNGLSSVANSITSSLQEGEFASLITDVKNVHIS